MVVICLTPGRLKRRLNVLDFADLERFAEGTEVTPELLKQSGVLSTLRRPVKVLASGELTRALSVSAHKFSMAAREKIEAAGGSVQEIGPSTGLRTGDGDSG